MSELHSKRLGQSVACRCGDAGIVVPKHYVGMIRRAERPHAKWVAVQVSGTAFVSLHSPHVKAVASVEKAEELLQYTRCCLRDWRRRARPPRFVVLGLDPNVRLLRGLEELTGEADASLSLQE